MYTREMSYFCGHTAHKLLAHPELVEDSSQTPTYSTTPKINGKIS